MLYPGYDNNVAGGCLAWLGIASIFVCIMLLSNSILQAHGMVNLPVVIAAIGGVIKLVVNYVLVGIESINVVGAAIGTLCCFAVVAIMDLFVIHRIIPAPPRMDRIFVKPLIASGFMALRPGLSRPAGQGAGPALLPSRPPTPPAWSPV